MTLSRIAAEPCITSVRHPPPLSDCLSCMAANAIPHTTPANNINTEKMALRLPANSTRQKIAVATTKVAAATVKRSRKPDQKGHSAYRRTPAAKASM